MNALRKLPSVFLALLMLVVMLTGCAEKSAPPPPPPVVPAPTPLAAQNFGKPVLYYATNRSVLDAGSDTHSAKYGGLRSRETSYGEVRASASGGVADGTDKYSIRLGVDRVTRTTRARFLTELERAAARTQRREVLLFIHGFDNSFDDAARTALRIGVGIGFQGAMGMYSWPSLGSPAGYLNDRNNAYWSVLYLKDFLREVVNDRWIGRVSVVVHSMGNEVFIRAYAELVDEAVRTGNTTALAKIRAIVLAAPDVDKEMFLEQYAQKLSSLGARVLLYASRGDMALSTSAMVQGGDYERLGKNVVCVPGLQVTDVSDVHTDFLGHSWVSDSRAVLTDLRCAVTEGCDRYTNRQLREAICSSSAKRSAPTSQPRDKSTSGNFYWRLVPAGSSGSSVTSSSVGGSVGGMLDSMGIKLPW